MNGILAVISCGLCAVAAGCGSDAAPGPAEQPAAPLVIYERGGGIAGLIESLTIEADGTATLTVGVDRTKNEFELSAEVLERLERELAATDFDAIDRAPAGTVCADCFQYSVEYEGRTVTLDDLDQPAPALQSLLDHLGELASRNYPPEVPATQSGG